MTISHLECVRACVYELSRGGAGEWVWVVMVRVCVRACVCVCVRACMLRVCGWVGGWVGGVGGGSKHMHMHHQAPSHPTTHTP